MTLAPVEDIGEEEEGVEEEAENEQESEGCERVGLPKEDEFMRKVLDPKLPSEEEVERHIESWDISHIGVCVTTV
eukprot:5760085-Karenia_brevis.AAC.1